MANKEEAYKSLLEDRLDVVNRKIMNLELEEKDQTRDLHKTVLGRIRKSLMNEKTINKRLEKIYGLKAEQEQLKDQIANYESSREFFLSDAREKALEGLDKKFNEVQNMAQKSPAELLEGLKQKGAIITKAQYRMMLPTAKLYFIKQAFLYREKGKLAYLSEQAQRVDANATINESEPNFIKRNLMGVYYKYQQNKLNRRITYREKKIDEFENFNSKNIFVLYGTSIIAMAKEIAERISEKFSKSTPQQTK